MLYWVFPLANLLVSINRQPLFLFSTTSSSYLKLQGYHGCLVNFRHFPNFTRDFVPLTKHGGLL